MKRIILYLVLAFICITLSSCADNLSKKEIISLVESNPTFLQQCVDESDIERALDIEGIKKIYENKRKEYIKFYCGGAGLVPSSSYYGFYYSPANKPIAVEVTETNNLIPKGDGWGWKEPDGDNIYYTERIMDCWYYYESHF